MARTLIEESYRLRAVTQIRRHSSFTRVGEAHVHDRHRPVHAPSRCPRRSRRTRSDSVVAVTAAWVESDLSRGVQFPRDGATRTLEEIRGMIGITARPIETLRLAAGIRPEGGHVAIAVGMAALAMLLVLMATRRRPDPGSGGGGPGPGQDPPPWRPHPSGDPAVPEGFPVGHDMARQPALVGARPHGSPTGDPCGWCNDPAVGEAERTSASRTREPTRRGGP